MPIQFSAVIAGIDAIVSAATTMSQLFKNKSRTAAGAADLQARVAALEANEVDQFKLIQDIAESVRTLTDDTRLVAKRALAALILSAVGVLLGATALLLVWLT